MNKQGLLHLAAKYADRTANCQEKLAVHIFFKKMQDQGGLVDLDEARQNKIYREVLAKIQSNKTFHIKNWYKIIAAAAIFFKKPLR